MIRKLVFAVAIVASLLFALASFKDDFAIHAPILAPGFVTNFGSVSKLLSLGAAAMFAARSARSFDPASAIRGAWQLMQAWFACFFVGQVVLALYELRSGAAPVPSPGDPFFFLGYFAVTTATVRFIAGYRATGLALLANRSDSLLIAVTLAAWGALFAWVALTALAPAVRSASSLLARVVNVGYPVLDFVLVLPTLVLLRLTFAFRGGRLWTVWATLLVGVLFFTAGDILFASPASATPTISALADIGFVMGYAFAARGAGLAWELVAE